MKICKIVMKRGGDCQSVSHVIQMLNQFLVSLSGL